VRSGRRDLQRALGDLLPHHVAEVDGFGCGRGGGVVQAGARRVELPCLELRDDRRQRRRCGEHECGDERCLWDVRRRKDQSDVAPGISLALTRRGETPRDGECTADRPQGAIQAQLANRDHRRERIRVELTCRGQIP